MDFETMVLQSVMMLIPTVLGSAVGSLVTWFKTRNKTDDALKQGMTILLKRELKDIHKQATEGGGLSISEREDVESVYSAYTALGGNGTGKDIYEDICKSPIKE